MDSISFDKLAPYLKDPLVLVDFALLLFFGLARPLIRSGLLTPVTGAKSYRVLLTVLLYGFDTLFDSNVGVNENTLTAALTQERQSFALLEGYGSSPADAIGRVKLNQSRLQGVGRPVR
jgi:hypothetical protein